MKIMIGPRGIKKFLLFIVLCFCTFSEISAQKIDLNFKNTPLKSVLKEVTRQTGYDFVYSSALQNINDKITVSFSSDKSNIQDLFKLLFTERGISYKINNKQVILAPKDIIPVDKKPQQSIQVRGKIVDEDNLPMPAVVVINQNSKATVVSENDGDYVINANVGDKLIFNSIGTVSQNVVIADQKTVYNIVMQSDYINLKDVVVTGYQTLSKERATGSFAFIDDKRLTITNLASTNFAKGLAGMTSGVLVDKNGELQIRGVSSIKSDTRPLIVVDGFPIESGNYTVNPNDIESVTVLKDAAAASIWGVRASNGVVVVKTKSGGGKDGKAVFNFTANLSFDSKPDFSYYKMASTSDFVDFEIETINKGWFKPQNADATGYSRVGELYYKKYKGIISETQLQEGVAAIKNDNNLSQQDLFYRKAVKQQYNLSIQGGSELSKYYVSAIYTKDLYTARGNDNEGIILNVKNVMQVLPKLTLTIGVNSTFNHSASASSYDFGFCRPYDMFVDENGNYLSSLTSSSVPEHLKAGYYEKGYKNWNYNAKQELDNSNNKTKRIESRFNIGLDYKIAEGINFSSKYLNELGNTTNANLQNLNTYYVRNLVNSWRVYDSAKGAYVNKIPVGPIYDKTTSQFNGWTLRNSLSVNKEIAENHSINAVIGTEVRKIANKGNSERYYNYSANALTVDNYDVLSLSNYTPNYIGDYMTYTWNPGFYSSDKRFFSLFANAAYTYKGLYTLSGSLRTDQSNLFGSDPKYRYQPIWSIGANWRVSGEKFMQNVDFVDRLIVRVTYGINGNIGNSSPYPIASTGKNYNTQENMITFTNPENQQLRPEKTAVTNVGIDFSLLKNALSGSIEYYYKKSYDLLGNSILDPTTGFTQAEMNTAEMVNKGVDLSLTANILRGEVMLDAVLNFGYNKNQVTKVLMPTMTASTYITGSSPILDRPLSYLYSYRWAGLSSTGDPQVYNAKGEVVPFSASEMTDVNAMKYVGTLNPPFYGGLMFDLSYKGFTLSPQFTWKIGHVLRLPVTRMDLYGGATEMISKRWQKAGDENITDLPRTYSSSSVSNKWTRYYRNADIWEGSASFIRLSSLTLSYDVPKKLLKNTFSGIKITAQGNNLWLWANNDYDIDPEYYNMRSGYYSFPPVKNFVLSINLNF